MFSHSRNIFSYRIISDSYPESKLKIMSVNRSIELMSEAILMKGMKNDFRYEKMLAIVMASTRQSKKYPKQMNFPSFISQGMSL